MFYVFIPVCLVVFQQKKEKEKKSMLAEAGGQTVLGPKISGLDFSDDPDLGFPPLGTIMSFKHSCVLLVVDVEKLLNSITFICFFVKKEKPYDKQAVLNAVFLKVRALLFKQTPSLDLFCILQCVSDLVQDLSVAGQELRQVSD